MFTKPPRSIKEWLKECYKNHTHMNKLMRQVNDFSFVFLFYVSFYACNKGKKIQ